MSNLTDALIAAKLVGGSGGSGGGSGLPEITPGDQTVVVAERSVSFSEGQGGLYSADLPFVTIASGVTYTVTWDGTTYTCVGSEISMGSRTGIVAGNRSIGGPGEDTGEPFVLAHISSIMNGTNVTTTTAGPHTIGVTTGTPQTPPDGYVLGVDGGEWKAVPSEGIGLPKITENVVVLDSVLDFESEQEAPPGVYSARAPLLSTQVGVGDAIIVEWDGTSYNETLYDFSGALAFGNSSIVGMGEDTGEPFFGTIVPEIGLGQCATNVSAGEHNIKVVKADNMQLYPDYGVSMIEGGEWIVKSNVITLDKGTSILLDNTSAIQGGLIGTLTANLNLSEYGVTLPNDVYLPVVAVKFATSNMETSFTLGISYYHNGTLTVRLKECTNTTYQANTVALTAVTLLIPQRYTYYGK